MQFKNSCLLQDMILINIRLNKCVAKLFQNMGERWSLFLINVRPRKCHAKAGDNHAQALEFVSNYYKTQKMCNKAVNTYPSTISFCS